MNPLEEARKELSDLIVSIPSFQNISKENLIKISKLNRKILALMKIFESNHPLVKEKDEE